MLTSSIEYFKDNQYKLPETVLAPIIIAWKLRTPENYGNLIRVADTIGAANIFFVGNEESVASRKIKRTAGKSYQSVSFCFVRPDELLEQIPSNYKVLALETATGSTNLFQTKLPKNMALVVGNEKAGIDKDFLSHCKKIVHIPLTGSCTSLNVSHAATITLFEWLRQVLFI